MWIEYTLCKMIIVYMIDDIRKLKSLLKKMNLK